MFYIVCSVDLRVGQRCRWERTEIAEENIGWV